MEHEQDRAHLTEEGTHLSEERYFFHLQESGYENKVNAEQVEGLAEGATGVAREAANLYGMPNGFVERRANFFGEGGVADLLGAETVRVPDSPVVVSPTQTHFRPAGLLDGIPTPVASQQLHKVERTLLPHQWLGGRGHQ